MQHTRAHVYAEPAPYTQQLLAAFWVALAVLCGLRAYIGLYGTRIYAHDAFMVLDGAWRMLNGQRPHVDFNSMIGPVAYLPTAIGLRLSGNTVAGFGYGQALAGVLVGVWAFFLGARLHPVPRVLFALSLTCVAVSPAIVGPSPFAISPGMTYNRYSYALLGLLLLECMQTEDANPLRNGLSTGLVCVLLAFLKSTALVVAVGLLLALAFFFRKSARRWLGFCVSFALGSLAFLAYLRFRVDLIVKDLALTAAAKHIAVAERYDLNTIFLQLVLALLIVFASATWLRGRHFSSIARQFTAAALIVAAASVLLIFGNFQRSELPLLTFVLILLSDPLLRHRAAGRPGSDPLLHFSLLSATAYTAALFFGVAVSMALGLFARIHTVHAATPFATPTLASFVPIGEDYDYVDTVNDGFALLNRHRLSGERVMSLDFTNPFSYGLLIPPAPGGTSNLQFHVSFDTKHFIPPDKLFGASELIMVPTHGTDPNLSWGISLVYGGYLQTNYTLVDKSAQWSLYRRTR